MAQEPAVARAAESARILAVDYGRARIGLAIADAETRLPRPLGTLERINRNEDMRRLRELAREHSVSLILVGLPLRLDGARGDMAEEATRFAQRAAKQIGVPVEMVDERLTSWEAERLMEEQFGRASRTPKAKPKSRVHEKAHSKQEHKEMDGSLSVDAVAAAVILKEYLERANDKRESSNPARSA